MIKNTEIAAIFNKVAQILKIKEENKFKVRAYERVVATLENLPMEVETIYRKGELDDIPGVGKAIAQKIEELINTGQLAYYEKLKQSIPDSVLELIDISEIGPKKAKLFYEKLGIDSIRQLEKAARDHQLQNLPGMGQKTEENILRGIQLYRRRKERTLLSYALPIANAIVAQIEDLNSVKRIELAGSLRRQKETIGDIDILIAAESSKEIMERFIALPQVKEVLAEGLTKSAILTQEDIHVDLRVVQPESFGAAWQYFTGSKAHNVRLREMAVKKGLKINEYGVFKTGSEQNIAGKKEYQVYQALGLPFIPPELREDRGEIENALANNLPTLVNMEDIKGDFHIHSNESDGLNSIEEMVLAAREKGYGYMAITDHTQSLQIAGGLDKRKLIEQGKKIEQINQKVKDIIVLKGIEVDIKSDGTLDLPDSILQQLDVVIAAIHSGFKQSRTQLMNRLIKAMKNPYVHIIAHPTGRIIGYREAYDVDIQKLIYWANQTHTALEINASPERMDLNDIYVRSAKEQGVKFAIGTDAHQLDSLDNMVYGISIARRAGLNKKDILNNCFQPKKGILKDFL